MDQTLLREVERLMAARGNNMVDADPKVILALLNQGLGELANIMLQAAPSEWSRPNLPMRTQAVELATLLLLAVSCWDKRLKPAVPEAWEAPPPPPAPGYMQPGLNWAGIPPAAPVAPAPPPPPPQVPPRRWTSRADQERGFKLPPPPPPPPVAMAPLAPLVHYGLIDMKHGAGIKGPTTDLNELLNVTGAQALGDDYAIVGDDGPGGDTIVHYRGRPGAWRKEHHGGPPPVGN